jgi:hypothetical protein
MLALPLYATSVGASVSAFDPASLSLTGWWRASYAGSPWAPTASAGSSGGNGNLTEATNPPATGAAVNGFTPADGDGSNDRLVSAAATLSLLTLTAGTIIVLFNADTAGANTGFWYANPSLVSDDSGGGLGLHYTTSGITATLNGATEANVTLPAATGGWHMVMMRWSGSSLEASLDGGAVSSDAFTTISGLGGSMRLFANYNAAAFFDGKILEVMTMSSAISDASVANIKSYLNSRYGLAL